MAIVQADSTASEANADRGEFPVVAIGASAGGLAPTSELLRALGERPGVAVVVIHHLDPTHESGLVEILSRATAMPVAVASDGLRAERDHVYVVPPNAGLLVEQGILKVVPRIEEGGLHLPIDHFFTSLALDRNALGVGVVLSGSGFDGSEGVKALRAEGGIAFAQDATAQHDSMPQGAIATGCVDFVLPPEGIARELVRLGTHPPQLLPRPARSYAESIIDTVRESLVVVDRELRVHSFNKAFQRAFKLGAREADGRRLDQLGRPELAMPGLRTLIETLGEGASVEDLRLEHADAAAAPRVFMVNARHLEGAKLILLALDDVTETERSAAAFREAELGLRDILLHAAEAILMIDAQGIIVFVNELAARTFGYGTSEELTGVSLDVLVPEAKREGHARDLAAYFAAPSPRAMGLNRELAGRRRDGTEFPIEVVLSPATRSQRVVAFVTDTTDKQEAERKIREYQDKLQRMAFDAALTEERERRRIAVELHDRIGQSLALAQIKLSSTRDALSGAPRTTVDEVVALLEQSAAETRTLTFELSPPVLYDLGLKEALSWLADEVERVYGIRIELSDDEADKPMDNATRALVFRAVRELLMNVFKHAKTPSAKVALKRTDDHFDIAVEDAGVGFDQEAASDRPSSGFGLLSVREQIRRLGGTLEIASAPSKGTRVSMRLPITDGATPHGWPQR